MGLRLHSPYLRGRLEDHTLEKDRCRKYGHRMQKVRQRNKDAGQRDAIVGHLHKLGSDRQKHSHLSEGRRRTPKSGDKRKALGSVDEQYQGNA